MFRKLDGIERTLFCAYASYNIQQRSSKIPCAFSYVNGCELRQSGDASGWREMVERDEALSENLARRHHNQLEIRLGHWTEKGIGSREVCVCRKGNELYLTWFETSMHLCI